MVGRPEAPRRGAGLGHRPLVLPRHQREELLGAVSSEGPRAWAGSQGCTEDVGLAAFLRSGQAPTQRTGGGFQWDAPASGKHSFFARSKGGHRDPKASGEPGHIPYSPGPYRPQALPARLPASTAPSRVSPPRKGQVHMEGGGCSACDDSGDTGAPGWPCCCRVAGLFYG